MSREEERKAWAKVVAKYWSDEGFRERLLAHPHEVLAECGITLPPGAQLHLHENTEQEIHITMPAKPSGKLSEEQLQALAAAGPCGVRATAGCV